MEYKYENVEFVEVKEAFKVHKHDDEYEITETIEIPVGAKGVITSMGVSSLDGFVPHYDIEIKTEDNDIDICVGENEMEKVFTLSY